MYIAANVREVYDTKIEVVMFVMQLCCLFIIILGLNVALTNQIRSDPDKTKPREIREIRKGSRETIGRGQRQIKINKTKKRRSSRSLYNVI